MKQREIKFRCWNKKGERWLDYGECVIDGSGQVHLVVGRKIFKAITKEVEVSLYTGLHDKNGKEIYEGDIVQEEYSHYPAVIYGKDFERGIVVWGRSRSCPECDGDILPVYGWTTRPFNKDEWVWLDFPEKKLEVIGNIFENPELLEEKKK